jgi:hypothetical protein
MHANQNSLHANYLRGAVLALAVMACGSGSGIGPNRQTGGIGGSSSAGGPSINGGAGAPSIAGGACPVDYFDTSGAPDPCAVHFGGGVAGGPSIGSSGSGPSGPGGGSGIVCAVFIDNIGNPACVCLPAEDVPGSGYTIVPACHTDGCCQKFDPPAQNAICECDSAASDSTNYGQDITCAQVASIIHEANVPSCP